MSPERQARFLAALRITWSIKDAARAAGVCRKTPYNWRQRDKAFAEAWDETLARGTDLPGDEAAGRDPEGRLDPAFGPGGECAAVRETDDRYLISLLKAHRPKRYKEGHGHEREAEQSNKGTPDGIGAQERSRSPGD